MNESELPPQTNGPWLEIHDDVISSDELVKEVERRAAHRRAELGSVSLDFPAFGHVSTYPEPTGDAGNAYLFYYLKQANQFSSPVVEPDLASSPATQTPVLGRLWSRIRGEMHNLVLFYVNRSVREQNQLNLNLISVLNEMVRTIQTQQAEIDALRGEVRRLTGEDEQTAR